MSLNHNSIKTASFTEYVTVSKEQSKNPLLDIVIEEEVTVENYCEALLSKVFELPQSKFPRFINYQTDLVQDELKWLNRFEKLLGLNENLFLKGSCLCRFNKMLTIIDKKRDEVQSLRVRAAKKVTPKRLINAEAEDRHFSFHEVKEHVDKLTGFNDKLIYLTEEIYEYKQADIISMNSKLQAYDVQCTHFIEKLQTMRKMREELEIDKKESTSSQLPYNKIKFNGNVNQLVDVFYQLSRELFVDGKSYLDGNTNDIIALIVNSFLDKEGKEISPQTVKTILKPSKEEKRPNAHKRLDIEKFL